MPLQDIMTLSLFSRYEIGPYLLNNRMVMAPLTRSRSRQPGNIPGRLNAFYYAQRASVGLIITEATQIAQQGQGYAWTPGIYSEEQIEGWRLVAESVHDAGGLIFMQLWHVGRISHPALQLKGALPVAPSAITPTGMAFITNTRGDPEFVPFVTPRALETDELPALVKQYVQAAKNALSAGLDGIEVHAANGYLLDQFINSSTNLRTDAYGGSIENRARLLLEVVGAVGRVCGSERVGVRISPLGTFNDMGDENPEALFAYVAEKLSGLDLAYLHVVDPSYGGHQTTDEPDPRGLAIMAMLRERFAGTLMVCGGYTLERAQDAIQTHKADLVAFGRPFIANPDLPERLRTQSPLNVADPATFYGGGVHGYADYPTLKQLNGEEGLPDFSVFEAG